jgi:hypothetical protein
MSDGVRWETLPCCLIGRHVRCMHIDEKEGEGGRTARNWLTRVDGDEYKWIIPTSFGLGVLFEALVCIYLITSVDNSGHDKFPTNYIHAARGGTWCDGLKIPDKVINVGKVNKTTWEINKWEVKPWCFHRVIEYRPYKSTLPGIIKKKVVGPRISMLYQDRKQEHTMAR